MLTESRSVTVTADECVSSHLQRLALIVIEEREEIILTFSLPRKVYTYTLHNKLSRFFCESCGTQRNKNL
jgi:hypothetical protein